MSGSQSDAASGSFEKRQNHVLCGGGSVSQLSTAVSGPRIGCLTVFRGESHVLTTSSMVGRLAGSADQHFSMNFHISVVRPSFSAACGLGGLFPWAIWMTTVSFLMFPKGTVPVNTSTASIANAKTSARLDAPTGVPGGAMISGASHRDVPTTPVVAATVKAGSEMIESRP